MIRGLLPHPIAKDLDVTEPTSCCRALGTGGTYCHNCDLLVGLDGLHVTAVDRAPDLLTVSVESAPAPVGCPTCGTVAEAHSRRVVRLVDAPCFDTPVVLLWRKRRYRCREDACAMGTFTEQEPDLARQVAWQLWRWGEDNEEIRDDWDKVQALWEQRITQVDDPDAYAVEFQWFIEWLPLIPDWTSFEAVVPLITDTAPFIARERRAWETVESYLKDNAEAHPSLVVEVYATLMNEKTRPDWISFTDTTAAILEPGLDEGPETRRTALDIAEDYFSDGDDTAEQFLDDHT